MISLRLVVIGTAAAASQPKPLPGQSLPTAGRGQRVSLERGVATRSKKNPGKRSKKGG